MPGGKLVTSVNFKVVASGNAKLNLYFARSWELDAKVASNSLTTNDISKIISLSSREQYSKGILTYAVSLAFILSLSVFAGLF